MTIRLRALRRSHWTTGALAFVFALSGCNQSPAPPAGTGLPTEAEALIPADDGSQLAILYGSELLGSVDGCGCMGDPTLGGTPYRASFTSGLRTARTGLGVLQVDAGASMKDVANSAGREVEDFAIEDDATLRALDMLGIDAANLTTHELPFVARFLREDRWAAAVIDRPALGRFVSANVRAVRQGAVSPPPYLVREIEGTRLEGGVVRIAVAGVTAPDPKLDPALGFEITDPATALSDALPAARNASDLVVVLAYMPVREAADLVAKLGDLVDVVVVASSLSGDAEPVLDRRPIVVYSWYKTQKLGVLGLRLNGRTIASARVDYVALAAPLPREERLDLLAAETKRSVRDAKERRFKDAAGSDGRP